MQEVFAYIRQTRRSLLQLVRPLSTEQLNAIPAGFNNNIIWNLGHLAVSTPALCYIRTGINKDIKIPFLKKYVKGSKPEEIVTVDEIEFMKEQLLSSIDQVEKGYNNKVFKTIQPYATETYGLEMHTIEEVLTCSLAHDNYHFAYTAALKKLS